MGLVQCFTAASVFPYIKLITDSLDPAYDLPPSGPGPRIYNDYLLAGSRVYGEDITRSNIGGRNLGALWVSTARTQTGGAYQVINLIAGTSQRGWPGWGNSWWQLNDGDGSLIKAGDGRDHGYYNGLGTTNDEYFAEPSGRMWRYGVYATGFYDGVVSLTTDLLTYDQVLLGADYFGSSSWGGVGSFAIDRPNDIVWFQWGANLIGQVSAYRVSTKAHLFDAYTAAQCDQITLTGAGYAYLHDVNNWLHIYNYDGHYYGSLRHSPSGGYAAGPTIGWDPYYKRLLILESTPVNSDGSSTLRVKGYYPQPEAVAVTPPVARSVPRKNRSITFLSQVVGEGGEAISGKVIQATGAFTGTFQSDGDGDILIPQTPASAGSETVTVTV